MKQIPLPIGPALQPGFDNFTPGPNAAALQHLHGLVADRDAGFGVRDGAAPPAPVYLWGPQGSGKTHLLRAWAAALHARGQRVAWFDAADPMPWTLQPPGAAVVIDRCDALDPTAQHAAFALFIEAAAQGVQLAAAGRLPPVDLPLRDDLRTRLGWGHVFAMQPLSEAETRAALRREADRRGIFLSDDVMDHLLTRFPRDLGCLMRLLDRLDTFGLEKARRITVPLVRQMLAEEGLPEAAADA